MHHSRLIKHSLAALTRPNPCTFFTLENSKPKIHTQLLREINMVELSKLSQQSFNNLQQVDSLTPIRSPFPDAMNRIQSEPSLFSLSTASPKPSPRYLNKKTVSEKVFKKTTGSLGESRNQSNVYTRTVYVDEDHNEAIFKSPLAISMHTNKLILKNASEISQNNVSSLKRPDILSNF